MFLKWPFVSVPADTGVSPQSHIAPHPHRAGAPFHPRVSFCFSSKHSLVAERSFAACCFGGAWQSEWEYLKRGGGPCCTSMASLPRTSHLLRVATPPGKLRSRKDLGLVLGHSPEMRMLGTRLLQNPERAVRVRNL